MVLSFILFFINGHITGAVIGVSDSSQISLGLQLDATTTSCGYVGSDLTLTSNVTNENTCFIINAHDITLDCAGYFINYSTSDILGYGINNTGFNNVTIRNCIMEEGASSTSNKYAIHFEESFNGTIENNTIVTIGNSPVLHIYLSNSTLIFTNNLTTQGNTKVIFMDETRDSNVTLNQIVVGDILGSTRGISSELTFNESYSYNNITMFGSTQRGVEFSAAENITFFQNIILMEQSITYPNFAVFAVDLSTGTRNSSFLDNL